MIALPVSLPDPSLPCYATVTEAAHSALGAAVALGGDTAEAGGAIYRHGEGYCFTAPVTQGLKAAVDYRIRLPAGDTLMALYHTHPGAGSFIGEFSPDDLALARRMHVAMYVAVVRARTVITYCPDTRCTP